MRGLKESLQDVKQAADEVQDATSVTGSSTESESNGAHEPSLTEQLMIQASEVVSGLVIMTLLLFFLLSSGRLFLRRLVQGLPTLRHKRKAVRIVRRTESELSRYLGTFMLINIGLGLVVGTAMYLFGMPNPALWGVMAGLLNFVPYLGPIVGVTITGVVGLVTFDALWAALLPAVTYFIINMIEGNPVTPAVMSWRLTLNPVVILLSIVFWTWLWGIPSGLLAVPMVTTLKIVCDNADILKPVAMMLGGSFAGKPGVA